MDANGVALKARSLSALLKDGLAYHAGDYGQGYWDAPGALHATMLARAASALDFLQRNSGPESEWYNRARIAYESDGGGKSFGSGVYALAEVLALWADQLENGLTVFPHAETEGVRSVASTDLMQQVRMLNQDKSTHPAASIVLAGAALEVVLRGVVDERALALDGNPGIGAYTRALRRADVITKQEEKDLNQIAGLRNLAAHGDLEELSRERAGLMEQQVNILLDRLRTIMKDAL